MQPDSPVVDYWNPGNFRVDDAINAEMWAQSPQLQVEIQHPHYLFAPGSVGPQQAMLEPDPALGIKLDTVLPWVPDLVGKEAEGNRAVLIYGSTYAGFIREYSGRDACMGLADYVKAAKSDDGWPAFQRPFLEKVVVPDPNYYGRLAGLLASAGVPASRIILSDLCPNSIVKRIVVDRRRQDDSRQPGKERASVFCRYVDHPVVEEWTWRRITESWAECIIALGSIAEHGLLRLFIRHEAKISCNVPPLTQQRQEQNLPPCWVDRPADPGRPLRYWLELGRWWTISIPGRDIRLLPAFHPARIDDYDPGYERTGKALAACLGVDGI